LEKQTQLKKNKKLPYFVVVCFFKFQKSKPTRKKGCVEVPARETQEVSGSNKVEQ
jgi:hypothetical protein